MRVRVSESQTVRESEKMRSQLIGSLELINQSINQSINTQSIIIEPERRGETQTVRESEKTARRREVRVREEVS